MLAADRLHVSPFELLERPDAVFWMTRALEARAAEASAREYHEWAARQGPQR